MFNRIGIIGDVHAEHEHLQVALEQLHQANCQRIICTGDLADGEGDLDSCVDLLVQAQARVVRGNHDRWVLQDKARHVPNAHRHQDLSDVVIEYLRNLPDQISLATTTGDLLLCHGVGANDLRKVWPGTARMPAERSHELDTIIHQGDFRFMVNGHVHYRTLIHFQAMTLLNAGTLRSDHHPGFALLDLDEGVVRGFEFISDKFGLNVHEVKVHSLSAAPHHRTFIDTQCFDEQWEPVTLYA